MKTLNDIRNELLNYKNSLYENYPIKSMAIFGSYSRSEQTNVSDLDILVDFNDSIGIRFIDLADEIEGIVGLKVDLVSKNGITEKYLNSITSDLVYV